MLLKINFAQFQREYKKKISGKVNEITENKYNKILCVIIIVVVAFFL